MDKLTVDVRQRRKCCFDFFYPMYAVITSSNEWSTQGVSAETESPYKIPAIVTGWWKNVDVLYNTDFNMYYF